MSRRRRTVLALTVGAGLALLAGAGEASAATQVSYSPSTFTNLFITDATNDADAIDLSLSGNTLTIVDTGTGGITTADPDCAVVNATTVTCPFDSPDPAPPAPPTSPVAIVGLSMNGGTDSFTNENVVTEIFESDGGELGPKTVSSGPGADSITTGVGDDVIDTGAGADFADGNFGNDTVAGGADSDSLYGSQGIDTVNGGDGRDALTEDAVPNGADSLNGDAGEDSISYDGDSPVSISFNGQPDDGHPGEGDNVNGMEDMTGTSGDDTLSGDAQDNIFQAGRGNDVVAGGGGNDSINPARGADTVDGGEGTDEVFGGTSPDEPDSLNGGPGGGDLIDYCCGIEPITIVQDGQANDGRALEADNLAGFEGFATGDGDDFVMGDASANQFEGNNGSDVLLGLGGGDEFFAGAGDDTLVATEATAAATAPARPSARRAAIADELTCDVGFDTVAASANDSVGGDCERRGASVVSDSAAVSSKGKAKLRVDCPAEEGSKCVGDVVLLSNGKQIASGSYKVPNGKVKQATAKLSKKGRKALSQGRGSLLVSAEARTQEPPGVTANAGRVQLTGSKGGGK